MKIRAKLLLALTAISLFPPIAAYVTLNDNPRNGCRLEKGAISLQGHDATTDLSFRNIRIEELPAEKKAVAP